MYWVVGLLLLLTIFPPTGYGDRVDNSGGPARASSREPSAPSSPGFPGSMAYDSDYFYVAIGTNSWKRVALSTWSAGLLLLESGDFILLETGDKIVQE